MTVSVVVVTCRRLARLGEILEAWLRETPDVWLCDCSEAGFQTTLPVKIVRAVPDPGNKIRHAVALLTSGDLVIKADDDAMPLPGLAADFARNLEKHGEAIYGIHGRTFHGRDYYHNTRLIGAKAIAATTPVDFVGVVTAAPRPLLPMDLRDCATEVEDLYWQMARYTAAKEFVIRTNRFHHLRESKDAGRLCGTKASREVRNTWYERWYVRTYRPHDRVTG